MIVLQSPTYRLKCLLLIAVVCSSCAQLCAELALARIFVDGAVLQRELPAPIWGTAKPGAQVHVAFEEQVKQTTADGEGKWMVRLDPLQASVESRVLVVRSNAERVEVKDVVVGEVWLCGGQSNMQASMYTFAEVPDKDPHKERPEKRYRGVMGLARLKEIQESQDTMLRQFSVADTPSPFAEGNSINGLRGWIPATPGNTEFFTVVGYYFGKELRRELGVPIGLIDCNHGGSIVEAWMPKAAFDAVPGARGFYEKELNKWRHNIAAWEAKKAAGELTEVQLASPAAESHYIPGTLYNGLVHPLIPYAMKGVIWYQGESNRRIRTDTYRESFAAMIEQWRKNWGQEKLYFFWAQLAYWKEPESEPIEVDEWGWADIMEQQRETLALVPDSGMAVLNDIGHNKAIHPGNKIDVGKRLSLWALNQSYGKELVPSGPLFRSAEKRGNKVLLSFDHAGSGLMTGQKVDLDPTVETDQPLGHFQICGVDRQWKWAEAKISGEDTVTVWHPLIADPVEVRYAWAANPESANLYNKEGLPTSVFKVTVP